MKRIALSKFGKGRERVKTRRTGPVPMLPVFRPLKSVKLKDGRAFSLGIALTRLSFIAFSVNQEKFSIIRKKFSEQLLILLNQILLKLPL